MSRKSLENACLNNGWFAYAGKSRGIFITPPPKNGQEPDLARETAAGRIAFSGSQQTATTWVKSHPQPGCPILNEKAREAIRLSGAPLRVSAHHWGLNMPDLPFGKETVHVTFAIGGDRNGQGSIDINRYMHADTYRTIPTDRPATLADFEAIGSVIDAPPPVEMWYRHNIETQLARDAAENNH